MALADTALGAWATDYDVLPYLSLPIAYTQPSRLAAIAALHGLPFPDIARARVLELGCASGGNLTPLAARWPDGHFTGVDLSAQQISDGEKRVAYFSLDNVALIQADIAQLDLAPESFDYVICHGVFSWTPPTVRDAILRLVGACLREDGIAAISYNVLPGWHLRSPVREYLRARATDDLAPRDRAARARTAIDAFAKSTGPGAYGALMRAEAKLLEKMPASYLLGEFLAEHNEPITVRAFAEAVAAHGLDFIGEADIDADARAALSDEGRRHIDQIGGNNRLQAAQELDFLSGRPFRRSLLRRSRDAGSAVAPNIEGLAHLHIAARLDADPTNANAYTDRHGRTITARAPDIAELFATVGRAYPQTVAVDDLVRAAGAAGARIGRALLHLLASGRALAYATPIELGCATDARPKVWAYARAEAALGLPGVTSLHHVAVALPKIGAMIAATADGANDRTELVRRLATELAAGRGPIDEPAPANAGRVRVLAERYVSDTLQHLELSGVLEPSKA